MFLIGEDLRAGRLERVLPDWSSPDIDILAVYPSRRLLLARVRAMVDFLARCFATRRAGSIGRSREYAFQFLEMTPTIYCAVMVAVV